jgi:LacI family transcriptional regulator
LERGFRRLAFCGDPRFNWSNWRCGHFQRLAKEAGCETWVHQSPATPKTTFSWHRERDRLEHWIRSLPRPIGVMACYDIKGREFLDACRDLRIAVPEEIAVIGVDDDRLMCELCEPPLSSVIPDVRRTGYIAAELLDGMMRGETRANLSNLIKPLGIRPRRSTDVLAIEDPEIAAALRFIREHACEGIQVADVLHKVALSRRVLESHFCKLIGRSPHEEILRVRLERAKKLLVETDFPIKRIAKIAGFSSEDYFCVAFRRAEPISPTEYRRKHITPIGET